MTFSPAVTPVDLRPRRIWFIVAALVATSGVLAAAGMMPFLLGSGGDLGQRFTPGQPVTVHLSLSDEKMVWARGTGQSLPAVNCVASRVDGREILQYGEVRPLEGVELKVDNERWRGLLAIHAEPSGTYEVKCMTSGGGPTPTMSIGDPPRFYGARDTAVLSLAAFGLASISLLFGAVLAIVVAVRRRSHRARLRQQPAEATQG
ncbi:hypothetical protein [Micromonospora sp. NPDC126480]|uniref:hypothetical protein n=1 Tax=Micromonospora sp. NPDC126480 TaxID=3155312 RepID=UPI00331D2AC8